MSQLFLTMLLAVSGAIRLAEASLCNPNPCKNGAICQLGDYNGLGWGFYCTCQPGFIGFQCQWDSRQCLANTKTPCQNGGTCYDGDDGRMCACPGGQDPRIKFGGYYCEIVNPCSSCPSNMVYCYSNPTLVSGRSCINANQMVIDE